MQQIWPRIAADRPPAADDLLEAARLAAVRSYGLLGREDIEGLDRLAGYVASLFGQSMAAVSFVDEQHVWFGGAFGLAARAVARDGSFCDETIRRPGPLLVPDALADARFRAHELVQAGVRSYVGVPIDDGDLHRLGTVCVFGWEPGSPAPDAVHELVGLARMTGSSLEHCRSAGAAPEAGRARSCRAGSAFAP